MATIVYIPKACKDQPATEKKAAQPATFSGSVTLRKPTFDEKYEYLDISGLEVDAEGNTIDKGPKENIAAIRRIVKLSIPHYISIDLTCLATGEKLTTIDDLLSCSEADGILIDIGMQIIGGFRLGNG